LKGDIVAGPDFQSCLQKFIVSKQQSEQRRFVPKSLMSNNEIAKSRLCAKVYTSQKDILAERGTPEPFLGFRADDGWAGAEMQCQIF
jgi:hypothetical protein